MNALRILAAATVLTAASPALAAPHYDYRLQATHDAAKKTELVFQGLNVIDGFQTIDCVGRNRCDEANPLWGKHPDTKTIIIAKVLGGAAHFAVFSYLNDRDPKVALRFAQASVVFQGSVVALNLRFTFGGR